MKTKRLAEFVMLAAALFLSHQAKAQWGCSGYPADCDTYVEYDEENNQVWVYSYTWDYLWLGWWGASVSVDFSTPAGHQYPSSGYHYEYADVDFSFWGGDGDYSADATHDIDFNVAGYTWDGTWAEQPLPTGETTVFGGWVEGAEGSWNQTLTGSSTWAGTYVRETDPGGGTDSCWFAGSQYDPFTSVDGSQWPVGTGNHWGPDYVGFFASASLITASRAWLHAPLQSPRACRY
jgi:hypothetical protein